ncbi:hypothetical protein ISF_08661 [Cordyceps fumosorosea ARSEF 2679]|uniref:Uncharacterized protein n=1 Tax=Cordyceps fumosorosea (strain ARSEF 2679) TaxID=1081104 RepID=A0A167LZD3_CORFA|nr:hypothetical protein ISF_08661 [Cordyceps fumosorosea ARSEF 2679]OAA53722.1 hypothetical protein ISF_08661 [Cordyceps fumosorosea ARSEF 2679]
MSTLAELESEFEMLAACCEAAKNDFTIKDDQRIELAQRYRVIHACLFAVRKEAVAAQHSSVSTLELNAIPTLGQLESKPEEHEKIIDAAKGDWSIPNARNEKS